MTLDDFLIDKRTVDRHIRDGKVDAAAYRRLLEALPDRSATVWRKPSASELPAASDEARGVQRRERGEATEAQVADAPL